MFKHLLVPLDGSRLAEAAIPAAASLSEKSRAAVTLLHIVEPGAPKTVHGEPHLQTAEQAAAYLERIEKEYFPANPNVLCHVHADEMKNVAGGIADHLLELGHDTVVMSAHGRGGLHRLLVGTIAQQVVALGSMPVLMIRPDATGIGDFECRRVLIPHDGVPAHESALKTGTAFARLFNAEVRLVMVIPTPGTLSGPEAVTGQMLPGATRAALELALEEGAAHLRRDARELAADGLTAEAAILRGDPAARIIEDSRTFGADMIILGTHGKSGTKAFWEGSVAARVAVKTKCSLLFVPLGKESPTSNV